MILFQVSLEPVHPPDYLDNLAHQVHLDLLDVQVNVPRGCLCNCIIHETPMFLCSDVKGCSICINIFINVSCR